MKPIPVTNLLLDILHPLQTTYCHPILKVKYHVYYDNGGERIILSIMNRYAPLATDYIIPLEPENARALANEILAKLAEVQ